MIEPYQRDKSVSSVARLLVGVSHDIFKIGTVALIYELARWP